MIPARQLTNEFIHPEPVTNFEDPGQVGLWISQGDIGYEIPLEKGVPSLAILAPDGTLLVSQKKGEFESTVRIGPEDVLEFLNKWKPQHGG